MFLKSFAVTYVIEKNLFHSQTRHRVGGVECEARNLEFSVDNFVFYMFSYCLVNVQPDGSCSAKKIE